MNIKTFPVLGVTVSNVPYELVKRHEKQAMLNHGNQTVERLAERGGLSIVELACVLENKSFDYDMKEEKAEYIVSGLIHMYNRGLLNELKLSEKMGLRPCIVKIPSKDIESSETKAYFHRWFDETVMIYDSKTQDYGFGKNALLGLVEYEDGTMGSWAPNLIRFTDR